MGLIKVHFFGLRLIKFIHISPLFRQLEMDNPPTPPQNNQIKKFITGKHERFNIFTLVNGVQTWP